MIPNVYLIKSSSISLLFCLRMHFSNKFSAFLRLPFAWDAIIFAFSAFNIIFSFFAILVNFADILFSSIDLNSTIWHLDKIVCGIFCGSVVTRITIKCSGGSSKVFNNALKECLLNICTSSKI